VKEDHTAHNIQPCLKADKERVAPIFWRAAQKTQLA